jgi:hypothetical protein
MMGVIALSSRQAGPSTASNDDPILSKSGLLVSTCLFESIADLPVLFFTYRSIRRLWEGRLA